FDKLQEAPIQLHQKGWGVVVEWVKTVFVSGQLLALPLNGPLLTINLPMGILNRAAPKVWVFSVGFPVSLIVGVVLLTVVLPNSGPFLESLFESGLSAMSRVTDGLAGRLLQATRRLVRHGYPAGLAGA
ncbi:flagellar biosynthetic protein FliR, partial [Achromobacter xylosoxidans]|uniref:flagellar biosynthetic protein FliR n=1 Tax=Alcaligenes xylosoxydans xylosoxydans TaxID=85698 RepID=UPI0037661E84